MKTTSADGRIDSALFIAGSLVAFASLVITDDPVKAAWLGLLTYLVLSVAYTIAASFIGLPKLKILHFFESVFLLLP